MSRSRRRTGAARADGLFDPRRRKVSVLSRSRCTTSWRGQLAYVKVKKRRLITHQAIEALLERYRAT